MIWMFSGCLFLQRVVQARGEGGVAAFRGYWTLWEKWRHNRTVNGAAILVFRYSLDGLKFGSRTNPLSKNFWSKPFVTYSSPSTGWVFSDINGSLLSWQLRLRMYSCWRPLLFYQKHIVFKEIYKQKMSKCDSKSLGPQT